MEKITFVIGPVWPDESGYNIDFDDVEAEVQRISEEMERKYKLYVGVRKATRTRPSRVVDVSGEIQFNVTQDVMLTTHDEMDEADFNLEGAGPVRKHLEKMLADFVRDFDWPSVFFEGQVWPGIDYTVVWTPDYDPETGILTYHADLAD